MATFSHRDIVTRRREYTIPAAAKWGACLSDVQAAITAALLAYRDAYDLPTHVSVPDDALRFFPGDDEIIISFEIEERL